MPVLCRCGAPLLEAVDAEGVTPLGGEPIPFRRLTDYVLCERCHSVYRVDALRRGRTAEESLLGTRREDESLADALERLLEGGEGQGGAPR
jgi:hypothetical protein